MCGGSLRSIPACGQFPVSERLDATGFAHMTLGATASTPVSGSIFDILGEATPFEAWLDIRTDLDVTGTLQCDATSLTLELGGVVQ